MKFLTQKNILKTIKILTAYLTPVALPVASAYTTLESIPGVGAGSSPSLNQYLNALFVVGIGLAGALAVLMIVLGGIQYIASGISPSAKEDAKKRILSAILGLLLALGSWIILHTINPDILGGGASLSSQSGTSSDLPSAPPPLSSGQQPYGYVVPPYQQLPSYGQPSIPSTSQPPTGSSGSAGSGGTLYIPPPPSAGDIVKNLLSQMGGNSNSDLAFQTSCFYQSPTGPCAAADTNKDGIINTADLITASTTQYDVNHDFILSASSTPAITFCLFKYETTAFDGPNSSGPYPPNITLNDFNIIDYINSGFFFRQPTVPPVPSGLTTAGWDPSVESCGGTSLPSPSFDDATWIENQIKAAGGAGVINLDTLYREFYSVTCDPGTNTCTWGPQTTNLGSFIIRFSSNAASRQQLGYIFYSSLHQLDVNGDLNADLRTTSDNADLNAVKSCEGKPKPASGTCARADLNNDGKVDVDDETVFKFFYDLIYGTYGILPWSLHNTELMQFSSTAARNYPDLSIINFCMGAPLVGACTSADVDGDCVAALSQNTCVTGQAPASSCSLSTTALSCTISAADKTAYLNAITKYDLNGDGIVSIR